MPLSSKVLSLDCLLSKDIRYCIHYNLLKLVIYAIKNKVLSIQQIDYYHALSKVSNCAKIKNPVNQFHNLTQYTIRGSDKSKRSALSLYVTTRLQGTDTPNSKTRTKMATTIHKRNAALKLSVKILEGLFMFGLYL